MQVMGFFPKPLEYFVQKRNGVHLFFGVPTKSSAQKSSLPASIRLTLNFTLFSKASRDRCNPHRARRQKPDTLP